MTFEEFFKKKRIDLSALQQSEAALFSEFKNHYEQMGEKSFDHTKKYWFNKLRGQFPLAIEIKTEKPKIENQLAEQTITESLIEEGLPAKPKPGFVPRFKAKIAEPVAEEKPAEDPTAKDEQAASTTPKPGFVPRFKAANMPKPIDEDKAVENELPIDETPVTPTTKLGFVPKFKAANMAKPVAEEKPTVEKEPASEEPKPANPPKLGFVPKFKAANMPKPVIEENIVPIEPIEDIAPAKPAEEKIPQPYKPRFNPKSVPPKAKEE